MTLRIANLVSDDHDGRMKALLASYAGPNALTADHAKQKEMSAAITAGADKYDTFDKTGWFIGPDNLPRFEIDDSKAKFDWTKVPKLTAQYPKVPTYDPADRSPEARAAWDAYVTGAEVYRAQKNEVQLQDIMDHPTLYEAYPQLRGVTVRFGDDFPYGYAGTATDGDRSIEFGPLGRNTPSLLLHEIQHLIQNIEGFAGGAPAIDPAYRRSAGEKEAYDTMYRFSDPRRKKDARGWRAGEKYSMGKYPALLRYADDPTREFGDGGPLVIDLSSNGLAQETKSTPKPKAEQLPPEMITPASTLDEMISWLQRNVVRR